MRETRGLLRFRRACEAGVHFCVSEMRPRLVAFARSPIAPRRTNSAQH